MKRVCARLQLLLVPHVQIEVRADALHPPRRRADRAERQDRAIGRVGRLRHRRRIRHAVVFPDAGVQIGGVFDPQQQLAGLGLRRGHAADAADQRKRFLGLPARFRQPAARATAAGRSRPPPAPAVRRAACLSTTPFGPPGMGSDSCRPKLAFFAASRAHSDAAGLPARRPTATTRPVRLRRAEPAPPSPPGRTATWADINLPSRFSCQRIVCFGCCDHSHRSKSPSPSRSTNRHSSRPRRCAG